MKCKKLLSAALAGAMALSLAVPAFAGDTDLADTATEGANVVDIDGELKAPTVKVTIPDDADMKVILNPYKLDVTIDSQTKTDQVINKTVFMKNLTKCNVQVSAAVTGTVGDGTNKTVTFATAPVPSTVKTKQVFLLFEMSTSADGSTDPSWKPFSKTAAANQIVVAAKAAAPKVMVVMGKSTDGTTAGTNGYAAFHVTGDCADQSTVAWGEDDAVNVSIAFTFLATGAEATAPIA